VSPVELEEGHHRATTQFEPATFARYDQPVPPGGADPPSPYDPTDAIYAATRLLCANGARNGTDLPGAIFAYNHAWWYVTEVLSLAGRFGQEPTTGTTSSAALVAVEYAISQLGTPYRWGGDSQGVGFDCSGLAQAAYRAAGVVLPRTAQAQ
jgi:cell wall-associated NlpC family hydrolase